MKKLLSVILAVIMILLLCSCEIVIYDETPNELHNTESPVQTSLPESDEISGEMCVTFLDVGQGDCTFIELPDGKCILIDAGESDNASKIKKYIKRLGYKTIDYVIATHPHADHIGAMANVIKAFDTGKIYMPRASTTTKTFERLLETIQDKQMKINTAKAGVIMLDDGALKAEFVAPVKDEYDDLNNYSAVLKLTYRDVSFLFTGDAEKEAEGQIKVDIDADILKVGHHGSSTSSSSSFLKKVSPEIAIISCGENNDYGHPHKEVVNRLEKQKIECYRTDINGNISVVTDGETYEVILEKN